MTDTILSPEITATCAGASKTRRAEAKPVAKGASDVGFSYGSATGCQQNETIDSSSIDYFTEVDLYGSRSVLVGPGR